MSWEIPLSDIDFGPEESAAVQDVLQSRWLTMGGVTVAFEQAFAEYTGAKHAIAVTNCTAGLHMACMAAGLGPGDEVIVPSLTFVATANAVRYTGATPVFADITSLQNLDISLASMEKLVTAKTRAVIVMHYGGYACDMARIVPWAKEHGLFVIEDAAHAVGSEVDGKKLGCWGDVGCFSFFSNKNLTTGEGGMLVTQDDGLAEQLKLLRSHGMTSMTWDRHKGHAWSYDVVALGYNYRIDEIRSALGLAQLHKLERNNERRRQIVRLYQEWLAELAPQVSVPFSDHPGVSSAHIMPVLLPAAANRTAFMEQMKQHGVQTSIHYPPIHQFTAYQELSYRSDGGLPVTEEAAGREVTLPLYPTMTDEQVRAVAQAVQESLAGI